MQAQTLNGMTRAQYVQHLQAQRAEGERQNAAAAQAARAREVRQMSGPSPQTAANAAWRAPWPS